VEPQRRRTARVVG